MAPGRRSKECVPPISRATAVLLASLLFTHGSPAGHAAAQSPELIQPPICSAKTATDPAIKNLCAVASIGGGHNRVTVTLEAKTDTIQVAGYSLTTENYNANYLTPVVEAKPGDTVEAIIINNLQSRHHEPMSHGDADNNPTNLHFFHGGIVTPRNARPNDAELGTGDNVYVHLKQGGTFKLWVPIPEKLDARVLENTGTISHPVGLNWYHSHLHGISSDQVMGGMSGLLSVGDGTANVRAACVHAPNSTNCTNDVDKDTADLRRRTDVRYAMLRDLPVRDVKERPDEPQHSTATWAPEDRDSPADKPCGAWDGTQLNMTDASLRLGFCQKQIDTAWLFTLNGQRFPTITIADGRNAVLRLGNVSANIGYWLELENEADGTTLPLTLLSVDGIVPARPVDADGDDRPVEAKNVDNLLLMPASRAEIYVRNDQTPHNEPQVYILRTKGLQEIGNDVWPEIQLARIVLQPNKAASRITTGWNALVSKQPFNLFGLFGHKPSVKSEPTPQAVEEEPAGCVRDLDPDFNEYRRVTFFDVLDPQPNGPVWSIKTEIIRPEGPGLKEEFEHRSPDPDGTTLQSSDGMGIPFEKYVGADEHVNWVDPKHVCVKIDRGNHRNSHMQLWALTNATATLHNFHIHQMKFRLATTRELEDTYHIRPPDAAQTCGLPFTQTPQPDYKCYDPAGPDINAPGAAPLWHDTIPMPPGATVFIVMSYDAPEQIGRFVFHCHILKHEDRGLMAPIEVWAPDAKSATNNFNNRRKQ